MNKLEKSIPKTDNDVKRKAIKLVISHLKKKLPEDEFFGFEHVNEWLQNIEKTLEKEEFIISEYIILRRELNEAIERVLDDEIRYKLRNSWSSLGKAIDKKAKII